MARYDVHPSPSARVPGYVLDVQADLLAELATRVVVPLLPLERRPRPFTELNPIFEIDGQPYSLEPQSIATVPRAVLKRPVTSLAGERDAITRALDLLLTGF